MDRLEARHPIASYPARLRAQDTQLQPATASGKGANGLKIEDGDVWVSNTTLGTLLRIPISRNGTAGTVSLAAQGVTGIDDFAFASDSQVVAAQNAVSQASIFPAHDRFGWVRFGMA